MRAPDGSTRAARSSTRRLQRDYFSLELIGAGGVVTRCRGLPELTCTDEISIAGHINAAASSEPRRGRTAGLLPGAQICECPADARPAHGAPGPRARPGAL